MNEVWSLLERLFEKVLDKALTYDKNESHSLRKCFEETKEHNLNLCQRKRECFEWLPSDSIENELFYNIMLPKVFELLFYNPRFRGSIFKNNVFKQKFNEQSDRLLTAFFRLRSRRSLSLDWKDYRIGEQDLQFAGRYYLS